VCSFDWGVAWTGIGAAGVWIQAVVIAGAAFIALRQLQSAKAATQFANFLAVRQQWDALAPEYRRLTGAGTVEKSRLALAYSLGDFATNPNADDEYGIVRLLEWMVQGGLLIGRQAIDAEMFHAQYSEKVIAIFQIVEPYLDKLRGHGIDAGMVHAIFLASDLYRRAVRGETTIRRSRSWRNWGFPEPRGPIGR
jgi:hypothetical protein